MKKVMITLLIASTLISCSSTKIVSSWTDEHYKPPLYKSILVWGLLSREDSALRYKMEKHLADDLKSYGYNAVTSIDIYGSGAFVKLTEQDLDKYFSKSGVDGLITIALLKKTKELEYQPPQALYKTQTEYNYLQQYYITRYLEINAKGYYENNIRYFWECNLFDTRSGNIVYSAKTNTFNPASIDRQGHENGLMIFNDMVKKKLIINRLPDPTD